MVGIACTCCANQTNDAGMLGANRQCVNARMSTELRSKAGQLGTVSATYAAVAPRLRARLVYPCPSIARPTMSKSRPDRTTQHFVMRSVAEAAREASVPEADIRHWIDEGHLPAVRVGRATLVNVLAVQSLALRMQRQPTPADGDWSGRFRRGSALVRGLGTVNVLAGAAGLSVFGGFGPSALNAPWWLVLCLANMVVGVALVSGLPWKARGPRRLPFPSPNPGSRR